MMSLQSLRARGGTLFGSCYEVQAFADSFVGTATHCCLPVAACLSLRSLRLCSCSSRPKGSFMSMTSESTPSGPGKSSTGEELRRRGHHPQQGRFSTTGLQKKCKQAPGDAAGARHGRPHSSVLGWKASEDPGRDISCRAHECRSNRLEAKHAASTRWECFAIVHKLPRLVVFLIFLSTEVWLK